MAEPQAVPSPLEMALAGQRTEAEAEAGTLTIVMGGRPYRMPALKIFQGEDWQRIVGAEVSGMEDGLGGDSGSLDGVLARGAVAEMRVLVGYDLTNALGGEENIKREMTQVELHNAVEVVLEAEFPFDEAARRSVVAVFGLPMRAIKIVTEVAEAEMLRQAKSASSDLPIGASDTPKSDNDGPANNSSSDGDTVKSVSKKRSKRA